VLAVADVYEALTSDRPYRGAVSSGQALAILRSETPARLDAAAVAALGEVLARRPEPVLGRPRAG
jgi:HD-GYP domain-containing protein (c-di-GMP phosphodiesterase class II)